VLCRHKALLWGELDGNTRPSQACKPRFNVYSEGIEGTRHE
jgi:hypothetical protein